MYQKIFSNLKQNIKFTAGLIAAGIIGGASASIVMAAIPDSGGVIHGCYSSGTLGTGVLRVVDSPSVNCNANETALNWSQTGPQGPVGPAGPQGPSGPAGSGGPVAYAHIHSVDDTAFSINSAKSEHITSAYPANVVTGTSQGVCIEFDGTVINPNSIIATRAVNNSTTGMSAVLRDHFISGVTPNLDDFCGPDADALVSGGSGLRSFIFVVF